jgi:hypothetical protein
MSYERPTQFPLDRLDSSDILPAFGYRELPIGQLKV